MTYTTPPLSTPYFRPKRLPRRLLRRQLPVLALCGTVVTLGLIVWAVAWRNLIHERLTLETGQQRARLEILDKEIRHLAGQIEFVAAYPRICEWARTHAGAQFSPRPTKTLIIPAKTLSPVARRQAEIAEGVVRERKQP